MRPTKYPKKNLIELFYKKKVRFSKYGSLTNTVTQLICHSTKGMGKREVEEILNVNTAQIVAKLFQRGSINRKKINGIFFYFNPNNTKMEKQLKIRQTERMEKMTLLLPEPERIIAVLVDIIQHPQSRSHLYQIYQRLSIEGIKITPDEIKAILLYYNLNKKKRLKY